MSATGLPEPYPLDELVKGIDTPQFSVLPLPKGACGFEMRRYHRASWATTPMSSTEVAKPGQGTRESFFKLLGYISGQNSSGEKIKMTAPVMSVWEQESGQYEGNNMKSGELQFYIADSQQDSPPTPTGSVSVRTKEELTVFVRAFGGDPTPAQYQAEFQSLAKAVHDAGLCAELSRPIRAGYTRPGDTRRRNEIMYPQLPC